MNHHRTLGTALVLVACLAAVTTACRSRPAPTTAPTFVPCTCGDAETDFDGCLHPKCAQGATNPDNPDCVCGPLEQEET